MPRNLLLLLLLLPALALAQAPIASLRVVDADGTPVGVWYPQLPRSGLARDGKVPFTLQGRVYFLLFAPDPGRFLTPSAYYRAADCTGVPHHPEPHTLLLARPGWTLYIPVPRAPIPAILRSLRPRPDAPCTLVQPPVEARFYRYQPVYDLHTRFTPPFRLQAVPYP